MSVSINGTDGITYNDGSLQPSAPVGKNLVINGNMAIDQRNNGASVAINGTTYSLDRIKNYATQTSKFTIQQNAGGVTPPAGFSNYIGATSSSAYSVTSSDYFLIAQAIEGLNTSRLNWGTANAKTVTLSFWARSSLTGTFGGNVGNNNGTRGYSFTYTIDSANTWEYKTVTIEGETSGTWLETNGIGILLYFSLGAGSTYSGTAGAWTAGNLVSATGATSLVGTSGATLYITGVQLEANTTATPFEHLQYSQQLALCKRYYEQSYPYGTVAGTAGGNGAKHTCVGITRPNGYGIDTVFYTVEKRANATVVLYAYGGLAGSISNGDNGATIATADAIQNSTKGFLPRQTGGTTLAAQSYIYHYTASSEL